MAEPMTTHAKALDINLDPGRYGTVAEIGAGLAVATELYGKLDRLEPLRLGNTGIRTRRFAFPGIHAGRHHQWRDTEAVGDQWIGAAFGEPDRR